jgi:F-type H+-transporting ATPase subunit b
MEALQNLGINIQGLIIYLINFGIIIVILTKLVFKPLLEWTDKRREQIAKNLNEAEEIKTTFEKKFAERDAQAQAQISTMQQEILDAKQSAEKRSEAILEETEAKRLKMIQDARVVIAEMKEQINKEIEADVLVKMHKVLLTVLKDVDPKVVQKSIDEEWAALKESR